VRQHATLRDLVRDHVERAIALGRRTFDFLQGPEVYKYRFGAHDTRVYRLLLARPDIDLDQAWMAGQSNA
jgi:hypothetical protein